MRAMGNYTAPNPAMGGRYQAARLVRVGPYVPKIVQRGNKIIVTNREIIMQVSGTFASGIAPAGSFQRSFGFRNIADTGTGLLGNNTWLGRIAGCYDKFRPLSATLEFVPSVAFTYSGQTAVVYDPDPNPTVTASFTNSVSGNRYVSTSQLSQPNRLHLNRDCFNRLPWYDTSSTATNLDVTSAGTVYLVTTAAQSPLATQAGGMSFGAVWIEYKVEFDVPSNPATATAALAASSQRPAAILANLAKSVVENEADLKTAFEKQPTLRTPALALIAAVAAYRRVVKHDEL